MATSSTKDPIFSFQGQYFFLSNFSDSIIEYEDIIFPTVEHAFQAAKTYDMDMRRSIAQATTPAIAKRMGRVVDLRSDWEDVKLSYMQTLLQLKFSDPVLGAKLADTGDRDLIEGNTWGDRYWGVCRGQGHNHLGRLLMLVRSEVQTVLADVRARGLFDKWKAGEYP